MSRTRKKDYPKKYDSRRFDYSCRSHGSCAYCRDNRLHFDAKARARANVKEQIDEYIDRVIGAGDPEDSLMYHDDAVLYQHVIDPWDFETRRELDL